MIEILTNDGHLLAHPEVMEIIYENSQKIRTHLILDNLQDDKRLESMNKAKTTLEKAGFKLNMHSYDSRLLAFLAQRFGLKDSEELYLLLAQGEKISVTDLLLYKRGGQLLESRELYFLTDRVALERVESVLKDFSFNYLEELLIALGESRISLKEVYESITKENAKMTISQQLFGQTNKAAYHLIFTCLYRNGLLSEVMAVLKELNINIKSETQLRKLKNAKTGQVRLDLYIEADSFTLLGKTIAKLLQTTGAVIDRLLSRFRSY